MEVMQKNTNSNSYMNSKISLIENLNFNDLNNFTHDVITKLYKGLIEEKNNETITKTLMSSLEKLKYLENILLPILSLEKNLCFTKELLFTLLIFINYKLSLRINIFEYLKKKKLEEHFTKIFEMCLDFDLISINKTEKIIYIQFLINSYQHIEYKCISKSCLKLVSILLWVNLSKESLKKLLMENEKHIEKWKMLTQLSKKQNLINTNQCVFFNRLLEDFLVILEQGKESKKEETKGEVDFKFLIKFVEFITDLISQNSTRKFLLPLIKEKHFYERCILILDESTNNSTNSNFNTLSLFQKMLVHLKFYLEFELNEATGENLSQNALLSKHYANINHMQNVAYGLFPDRLSRIYLKNISLIDNTENIKDMLDNLNEEELLNFASCLNLLPYKLEFYFGKKKLIYQIFLSKYERKVTVLEQINNLPLYPDEKVIWDRESIPDEYINTDDSLPIPKLNLQFLTHYDYLLRNFNLFRFESIYEIRSDIEDVVRRMHPSFDTRGNFNRFDGWARMGVPIKSFRILSIKQGLIGKLYPQEVLAEIEIDMKGAQAQIKTEWDKLKRHDVLFVTSFHADNNDNNINDDMGNEMGNTDNSLNVKFTRGCEIISIFDEENNEVTDYENLNKKKPVGNVRKIQVNLDQVQYTKDMNNKDVNAEEMYSSFTLLIKRKPEQNNFKAILETIRDLMNSITVIPKWLEKIFLGYGEPNGAHYTKLGLIDKEKVDFRDTFIDQEHFNECFVKNENIPEQYKQKYKFTNNQTALNGGTNTIRFTKKQIEAIHSGVNCGLTLIVGPPGTGKTDVAVQMINLLYHNFPNQKILIVTHSNHALNDIFEKITKLDIEERYLLRLGMGQKDLSTEKDFSKNGRVNYMLQRRIELMNYTLRLAHSINNFTFEEYTCEHALNLYEFNIKKRIQNYEAQIKESSNKLTGEYLNEIFPFINFFKIEFSNNIEAELKRADEHLLILKNMFKEVEELRAFELLRNNYERGNHLLVKGARIIAMTCTHAALKRKDFIKLGFEYDNIIMEEAAQILEVETFIPMLLQNSKGNESKLKRVVLIGDNNQLPPIIKSNAFKLYGRMDQSLFNRFIRMDVPYVALDMQGRSRPSIVDLYRWNYENLFDLPSVIPNSIIVSQFQYTCANAGFTNELQFINVPDFDNRGEYCPTPYYYQNLAEAEYVISTFMYMCLIGYDPKRITILTTYNGQKALIKDIFKQKCSWNPIFNSPAKITTVDKYQGAQNDFVLLSLVRTSNAGHIRDLRRLIVALSRARLGLYVFGRWNLFSSLYEMKETFNVFENKPRELCLAVGEEFPTARKIGDDAGKIKVVVEDFRHMYRIVQELLKIKFSTTNATK